MSGELRLKVRPSPFVLCAVLCFFVFFYFFCFFCLNSSAWADELSVADKASPASDSYEEPGLDPRSKEKKPRSGFVGTGFLAAPGSRDQANGGLAEDAGEWPPQPSWPGTRGLNEGEEGEPFSPLALMLRAVGVLLLVIGLMVAIAAIVRKLGLHQGVSGGGQLIRLHDTRALGTRKYVGLIEVADQFFLVGISEQQVNLISRLDNEEKLKTLLAESPLYGQTRQSSFADILNGILKPGEKSGKK